MKKCILIPLLGIFLMLTFSSCGNKGTEDLDAVADKADVSSSKVGEGTEGLDTAADKPEIKEFVNEYTPDDEESLIRGGRLAKYNNIVVYIGEASGHIFMQDLESQQITELSKDRPDSIYFDGEWIFYSLNRERKGIYRLGLDGSVKMLSEDHTLQIWIYNKELYYTKQIGFDSINGTPQGELYKIDFDGQNKTKLLNTNIKNYFKIHNDWIYYTRLDDRSLNRAKLDGSNETMLAKGRTYIQLVTDNYIYYTDYKYKNGEALHILNLSNGDDKVIGPWSRVLKYDGRVFIQTRPFNKDENPEDNFWILMFDEEKDEVVKLLELIDAGIDTFITVKHNWVYLSNNSTTYRINLDDTSSRKEIVVDSGIYWVFGEYGYYFDYGEGTLSDYSIKRFEL